jgi:hypothetical protein
MPKNNTKSVSKVDSAAETKAKAAKEAKDLATKAKAKASATQLELNDKARIANDTGTVFEGISDSTFRAALKLILGFRGVSKGASVPMKTNEKEKLAAFCAKNRGSKLANALRPVLEDAKFVLDNGFGKATDDVFALQAMLPECEKAIARKPKLKPTQRPAPVKAQTTFTAPKLKAAKAPVAPSVKRPSLV